MFDEVIFGVPGSTGVSRTHSPPRGQSHSPSRRNGRLDTTASAPEYCQDGRKGSKGRINGVVGFELADESRRRPSVSSWGSWWPYSDGKEGSRNIFSVTRWRGEKVFPDADEMKDRVRKTVLDAPAVAYRDLYKHTGCCQRIARSTWFEYLTLVVIASNACWIAIDADHNPEEWLPDAELHFQVAENAFSAFFVVEWLIRFCALSHKCDVLIDRWFLFDSFVMAAAVVDTWIVTLIFGFLGDHQNVALRSVNTLRFLRLLRILRLSRMVRLMRAMPELIFMIRGMLSATRSVFITMILLFCILFSFAVAFRQLSNGTDMGEKYFGSVLESMYTLLLAGTLLDNLTATVKAIGAESRICVCLFFVVVLLAALTVMNMLIGVTCEVVSAVARTEKERAVVSYVKERMWQAVWDTHIYGADTDSDGLISKEEFRCIMESPEAFKALQDVGVDVVALVDLAELIFQSDQRGQEFEKKLDFHDFMDIVLQLRGGNPATVKDIVDLRRFLHLGDTFRNNTLARMEERQKLTESRLLSIEHKLDKLLAQGQLARDPSSEQRSNKSALSQTASTSSGERAANDVQGSRIREQSPEPVRRVTTAKTWRADHGTLHDAPDLLF